MPRLVIPIDGIRIVAPPERELDSAVEALQIASPGDLLFSLDELDPIFKNENQSKEPSTKKKGKKMFPSKPPTASGFDMADDEQVVVVVASKKPVQPSPTISTINTISAHEQDVSSSGTPTMQQPEKANLMDPLGAEKIQAEEDDLMDRLDAEITQAEQDDLMERLDQEIRRHEEHDLMERLLHNIDQAISSEWARANSLVEGVETAEERTFLDKK